MHLIVFAAIIISGDRDGRGGSDAGIVFELILVLNLSFGDQIIRVIARIGQSSWRG